MSRAPLSLLLLRRFRPLFNVQFLGAFNDNMLKYGITILVTYKARDILPMSAEAAISLAAGLFIIPYFLFSALAGRIADRYSKARVTLFVKIAEVAAMLVACVGFWLKSGEILFGALFLMGAQSAFFGPIKYGVLPELLDEDDLLPGNALVEAGTFAAIISGTFTGGALIMLEAGRLWLSMALLAVSAVGVAAALGMPELPPRAPRLDLRLRRMGGLASLLLQTRENRPAWLSILGISWFWLAGTLLFSQLPAVSSRFLDAPKAFADILFGSAALGVCLGALFSAKALKGRISARLCPYALVLMSVFVADLAFAFSTPGTWAREPQDWLSFGVLRVAGDTLMTAFCAGLYSVPLYTIMQKYADPSRRAQTIAANNIMNAAFVAGSSWVVYFSLGKGVSLPEVFLGLSALSLVAAALIAFWTLRPGNLPQ